MEVWIPQVSLEWIDTTDGVLQHMGCPSRLRVRVAMGAIQKMGKIW